MLPCFAVSVAACIIFELAYQPYCPEWVHRWYAWIIWLPVSTRVIAVAEAFLKHSDGLPHRRLIVATTVLLGLFFAVLMSWHVTGGTVLMNTIQARRAVIIGSTGFLAVYVMLIWSTGRWIGGFAGRHVLFMTAICVSFAWPILATMALTRHCWWTIDPLAYGIRALIYFGWAGFAIQGFPPVPIFQRCPVSAG